MNQYSDPLGSDPTHCTLIFEIPLHNELSVAVDVDVAGTMIPFPGDENMVSTPDLWHRQTLPPTVTLFKAGARQQKQTDLRSTRVCTCNTADARVASHER